MAGNADGGVGGVVGGTTTRSRSSGSPSSEESSPRPTTSRAVLGVALALLVALAGCSASLSVPGAPVDAESGEHLTFTVDVVVECAEQQPETYDTFFTVAIGGVDAPVVSTDAEQVGDTITESCEHDISGYEYTGYSFNATVTLTVVAPEHGPGAYDLYVELYQQGELPTAEVTDEGVDDEEPVDDGEPEGSLVSRTLVRDGVVYAGGSGEPVPDYVESRDERTVTNTYVNADRTTMRFEVGIMRGYLALHSRGFGGTSITIDVLRSIPGWAPAPDDSVVSAIDVELDGASHITDRSMTVRMPVLMNGGTTYDLDALRIVYYDPDASEWVVSETTVADRTVGSGYDIATLEGSVPYPTLIAVANTAPDDGGD